MIRDHHSLVAASSNTNPSQFAQFNPYLVGGIPTPLKNHGLSSVMMKFPPEWKVNNPFMVPVTSNIAIENGHSFWIYPSL
jgi:hypothetical protein